MLTARAKFRAIVDTGMATAAAAATIAHARFKNA